MPRDFAYLETLPRSLSPEIIEEMPVPLICFDSNLEAKYLNSAFASFVELDNTEMAKLTDIEVLRATDIMPEYQPDWLHSIDTFRRFIHISLQKGIYQYPWVLRSINGKPISTQMSIVAFADGDEFYILCYFLYTLEGTKTMQASTKSKKEKLERKDKTEEPKVAKEAGDAKKKMEVTKVTVEAKNLQVKEQAADALEDKKIEHISFEDLPFIKHVWSKDLKIIDYSPEVKEFFHLEDQDDFALKFFELCPLQQLGKKSQDLMQEYIKKAFEKGFCKFKWLHKDTNKKILPCEVTLIRSSHEGNDCVLGYTQDLSLASDHVQEFAKVQESLRTMIDDAPMAITLWDKSFTLRDANAECARLFGFNDKEEFLKNFGKCIPKLQENGEKSFALMEIIMDTGFKKGYHRAEFALHHHMTREIFVLEITLVRQTIWNEDVIVAYMRDTTEVKNRIQEMKHTEERIQTILDITPLGINVWDHNFNLIECNAAIVKMYGFEDKKAYFSSRYRVIPRLQPDGTSTIPLARDAIQHAFETGHSELEIMTYDVKGNPIPVKTISKRAQIQGQNVVISYVRDLRNFKAMLAEIHTAEQELRTARDIAERSAQAKSEFLGNMSHEIRTPLNGVLGLLHVLQNTILQPEQQEYVSKSIMSADKLLGVVNNILDFSRIDAGTFEMHFEPFTLNEIIDEIKLVYEPQITQKGLTFNVFINDPYEKTLLGDSARLRQVLFNVLNNAVGFTEEGFVTLNVSCTEENTDTIQYLFSVEDSGVGMSKAQCLQLFSPFMQGDTSLTRKHGGTGLGLAISRSISKYMGGDMWVKSEKDKGTTLYFSMVFDLSMEKSTDALGNMNIESLPKHADEYSSEAAQSSQKSEGLILFAEDNEINQLITIELLKNKGYTVHIANNGMEAVDMVKKGNYDMVLMDIQMPVMDGFTATAKIRALEQFAELPIVAMSAHAMANDKDISLQRGMNDHLTKPILPSLLYESVAKWTQKKNNDS